MTIQWSFEKSYHAVHWGNARVTYPLTCNHGIHSQKSARYSLLYIQWPYTYLLRNLPVRCTKKRQGWTTFWQPTTIDILKGHLATQCSIYNDYTVIFSEIFSCGAPRKGEGKLPSESRQRQKFSKVRPLLKCSICYDFRAVVWEILPRGALPSEATKLIYTGMHIQ